MAGKASEVEIEPLKGISEPKANNIYIDPETLQEEDHTFERETKFARIFSAVLYVTFCVLDSIAIIQVTAYLTTFNTMDTSLRTTWETLNSITFGTLMVFAVATSLFGFITLFRIGGTSRLIQNLKALAALIASQAAQLEMQAASLGTAVGALNKEILDAKNRQENLDDIVHIGNEIGRLGKKINNKDVGIFFNDIAGVEKIINVLQRQINKNKMIQKFYELEQVDGKDGLSRMEYNMFLNELDKQTRDTWRTSGFSWKRLSGNDDIIDIEEFTSALDTIFNALDREDEETVKALNRQQQADF